MRADQLTHSADQRLARALLQLAETSNGGPAGLSPISNPVSQTMLANSPISYPHVTNRLSTGRQ